MSSRKLKVIIVLIVLVAFGLRFYDLGGFEVASDEGSYAIRAIGWNDFMVSTSLTTPWNWYIGQDLPAWTQLSFFDHPPLHFASIWLSTHVFGINLEAVRLPSVIFGTLSVLMIMVILIGLKLPRSAIWSGLLLTFLPWHIWISRQAQQESLLIFLLLAIVYLLQIIKNKPIFYWILTGVLIGAAALTKYSAIVILPLLIYYVWREKWIRNSKFWFLILSSFVVLIPLFFYNIKTYQLRGHFDLQIARLLHQDLSVDWPANVQMIVQGGLNNVASAPFLLVQWMGIGSMLVVVIGLIVGLSRRSDSFKSNLFVTFGMALITSLIAALTLLDPIRASIVIPFLILSFGLAITQLPKKFKLRFLLPLISVIILIPAVFNLYGSKLSWPTYLARSFEPQESGFLNWESWLEENLPYQSKPIHYSSMNSWAQRLYDLIIDTTEPIIIFDQRFDWFALNWHFQRHIFYTTNYPVIHPTVFTNFLITDPDLPEYLIGKQIIYIQPVEILERYEIVNDKQANLFDNLMSTLISNQDSEPEIIMNNDGQPFIKVWRLSWDPDVRLITE